MTTNTIHPDLPPADWVSKCGRFVLYRGDCLDVLPRIPNGAVDAVVTDPPYGIGRDGSNESTGSHGGRKAYEFRGWDESPPPPEMFDVLLKTGRFQIIWGANYFTKSLPPSMGWLFWDKGQRICGSDGELAYTNMQKALRVFTINRVAIAMDGAVHPTQKPVALMKWCIDQLPDDCGTILDPFAGSASTGVACVKTRRRFIGIEIDDHYFNVARKRIEQAITDYNGGPMFENIEPQSLYDGEKQ